MRETSSMMRIGEVAAHAQVNPKTVRYYESIGLMPEPHRTPAGYRTYDAEAVDRLRFIRDSQATGLTLAEIQSILELKDSGERACRHTRALLQEHLIAIDEQLRRLESARRQLIALADRADQLDPAACIDPNRCQVIDRRRHADAAGSAR